MILQLSDLLTTSGAYHEVRERVGDSATDTEVGIEGLLFAQDLIKTLKKACACEVIARVYSIFGSNSWKIALW